MVKVGGRRTEHDATYVEEILKKRAGRAHSEEAASAD